MLRQLVCLNSCRWPIKVYLGFGSAFITKNWAIGETRKTVGRATGHDNKKASRHASQKLGSDKPRREIIITPLIIALIKNDIVNAINNLYFIW